MGTGMEIPATAWDAGGHEVIATIAYEHLNPQAQQAVTKLAHEMDDANWTYNAFTLACWMDDLRRDTASPDHARFLSWHYIDLGLDPRDPKPSLEPGDDNDVHGNIVQALKRAMVVLQGGTDPYIKSQAMACAMVMHLVGDIHQPLHCATKYFYPYDFQHQDAGGNKEYVLNGPPDNPQFSLHAFWDSVWCANFDASSGCVAFDPLFQDFVSHHPQNIRALAEALGQQPAPQGVDLETHIDQWAKESNAIARDFVYRDLTTTENRKDCRLSSEYVAKANALARRRLVLAGWRLATLLNHTLGASRPVTPPVPYPAGPPE
jgi:hypothetical protein